jgi:hypothetical protein
MTSLVSIRMDDELLQDLRGNAELLHVSQTDYIRRAIAFMNKRIEKRERRKRIQRASLLDREESMRVNAEFSEIEYDPED